MAVNINIRAKVTEDHASATLSDENLFRFLKLFISGIGDLHSNMNLVAERISRVHEFSNDGPNARYRLGCGNLIRFKSEPNAL